MQVSKISQGTAFKKLYYSESLKKELANPNTSPETLKSTAKIKNILQCIGADRKKYVDVILCKDNCGFFGVISSKKQGTPYNPDYICRISEKKKDIKTFYEWVNSWNYAYSPKGLREKELLEEKVLKILAKDKEFRNTMKTLM